MTKENETKQGKKVAIIVTENSKKLDPTLIALESGIRSANKSFLIIGANLTVINESKMYNQRGFTTFEMYVNTIFDFTRDYAYKIMNATRIYNLLKNSFKPTQMPKVETHCRPLTKIEKDEDVIKIWQKVIDTGGQIMAKTVIDIVNVHLGKSPPAPKKPDTPKITNEGGDGGSVGGGTNDDETSAVEKVRILEARVTELENDLEKAQAMKSTGKVSKMARQMIQAGFAALATHATDKQRKELVSVKAALLG